MEEKRMYLFLDIIKRKGSVSKLIKEGLSFSKIAELTQQAIIKGIIVNTEDGITLTVLGEELLAKLAILYKRVNKNEWIEVEKSSKISKLDNNDVFLPNQDDLWFS